MILKELRRYAESEAGNERISDVRIGLCYTAVRLESGKTGVAYTFREKIPPGCISRERPFAGEPVSSVLKLITSADLLERTVGIAAVNALVNRKREGLVEGDALEILSPKEDDVVGMVGFFGPFVPILKQSVRELRIFEKVPKKAEGLYPEKAAYELLPSCSVAIITATSLINETFEPLAEAAARCRKTMLVGSSTPLAGDLFGRYGINVLSGIIVTGPEEILRIVGECGGTRHFRGNVKKVNQLTGAR
ncbi:MAG: DUF364 domain-containing protein [Spirochaetes bacterium]|nr:DUF364 domain-containing protein [Spirochaetota bacterium]